MKLIKLSARKHGQFYAKVDDEDYEYLNQWKWSAYPNGNTYYVTRTNRMRLMHRVIMKVTDPKVYVDHKDHDGLNCQKYNLRKCSQTENNRNTSSRKNSSSKYLGVSFKERIVSYQMKDGTIKTYRYPSWCACIEISGKTRHLGFFKIEEDAARAYDEAAKELFREFANLNFKDAHL